MGPPSELPYDPGPEGLLRVTLLRTWSVGEAELVRHLLRAYGLPCHVAYGALRTGEVRVLVTERHRAAAASLLADHRRRGFELLRGGRGRRAGDAGASDSGQAGA